MPPVSRGEVGASRRGAVFPLCEHDPGIRPALSHGRQCGIGVSAFWLSPPVRRDGRAALAARSTHGPELAVRRWAGSSRPKGLWTRGPVAANVDGLSAASRSMVGSQPWAEACSGFPHTETAGSIDGCAAAAQPSGAFEPYYTAGIAFSPRSVGRQGDDVAFAVVLARDARHAGAGPEIATRLLRGFDFPGAIGFHKSR